MESFGMVLLEAMASGAPVVASDIEGYHEVVDDGVQGVLVRAEDPDALASALVSLLRDPARRRTMSDAGREKAQRYSWRVVAARVLEYYAAVRERLRATTASADRAVQTGAQRMEKPV
jgi:phosphatidylinositol alpha-mannosyltransferase